MDPSERFYKLLDLHVKGSLSQAEKDDFFKLLVSGTYDSILELHVQNSISQITNENKEVITPLIKEVKTRVKGRKT